MKAEGPNMLILPDLIDGSEGQIQDMATSIFKGAKPKMQSTSAIVLQDSSKMYASWELFFHLQSFDPKSGHKLQALMSELRSSANVILPIMAEEDRSILKHLEEAGLDYIGSPSVSGSLASDKHRSNLALHCHIV